MKQALAWRAVGRWALWATSAASAAACGREGVNVDDTGKTADVSQPGIDGSTQDAGGKFGTDGGRNDAEPSMDEERPPTDARVDVAKEHDGSECACVPADGGFVASSLDCFCSDRWSNLCLASYDDFLRNPCERVEIGPGHFIGHVAVITYAACNVIAVQENSIDSPSYTWFFDATTHALIGVERSGMDAAVGGRACIGLPFETLRAGVFPSCTPTHTEELCPHDGGAGGSIECGEMRCKATDVCIRNKGGVDSSPTYFYCVAPPASCGAIPDCACMTDMPIPTPTGSVYCSPEWCRSIGPRAFNCGEG
jgi:hypothetical protein